MKEQEKKEELREKSAKLYQEGLSIKKVAKELGVTDGFVYYSLKKNNVTRRSNKVNSRKYSLNQDYFNVIDSDEKAYWFGFIYADGHIGSSNNQKIVSISLDISDKYHLEKLSKELDSERPLRDYKSKTNFGESHYCKFLITSETMYEDLKNKGLVERKSNIKSFPNDSIIEDRFMNSFIRGYFDGNGSVTFNKKSNIMTVSFHSGSVKFLEGLIKFLDINRSIEYRYPEEMRGSYVRFSSKEKILNFYDYIYKNSSIHLERKHEKFLEAISQFK